MKPILEGIRTYFDSVQWNYTIDEDENAFRCNVQFIGENVDSCDIIIYARGEEYIQFLAAYPFRVSLNKKYDIMEYITRVNYGMYIGSFQMNLDSGTVIFSAAGHYTDGALTSSDAHALLAVTIRTMERYGDGFFDVIYGGKSPKDVVEFIHSSPTE